MARSGRHKSVTRPSAILQTAADMWEGLVTMSDSELPEWTHMRGQGEVSVRLGCAHLFDRQICVAAVDGTSDSSAVPARQAYETRAQS